MKARIVEYFRTNKWWILSFLLLVLTDAVLTCFVLINKYGMEANPFVQGQVQSFDWNFHIFRIEVVLLIIPLIAMTPWAFTRNWLLQSVVVAYVWTVLNSVVMLLSAGNVNISVYQLLPSYLYLLGFAVQFLVGLVFLYCARLGWRLG